MESQEEADQKSAGCKSCHTKSDSATMHSSPAVRLGCTDCHGGNEKVFAPQQASPQSAEYIAAKNQAHPQPHVLSNNLGGALPVRAYTAWLKEDPVYIRFINPGDLRIASAHLRAVRLSLLRGAKGPHQHDVARSDAVGRGLV